MSETIPRYWFGAPPTLHPDERFVASYPANRTQGKRAVGGGLHLTTQRLRFCPNVLDVRLGGRPWECAHAEITAAGVEPGRFSLLELFSGGLAKRLRIHLGDRIEYFVIRHPADRAAELSALLGGTLPTGRVDLPAARVIKE
ncbi:hypothetical protein BH11MYX2_BH11MYX2_11700 [soil metagenome]